MKHFTLCGGSDFGFAASFIGGKLCDYVVWWLTISQ
jgi:hypothetical protein